MNRKERAVALFSQHYNCSQSVFAPYRQVDAMDETTALKLATVFGAGVACTGSGLCGAVSGALMALSMKHGMEDSHVQEAKIKTYALSRKFMEAFKEKNGSCRCEEIIGFNIGTPENLEKAHKVGMFETKCLNAVRSASEILETML